MIPVQLRPEPDGFPDLVRKPGAAFLAEVRAPTSQQFGRNAYWQRALPDMRRAYKGVCAYSAHWISGATGTHSIDHYVPKSVQPHLAYEWDNFRYASLKLNSRKGTRTDILDPFCVGPDWFILDLNTFIIKPNPSLPATQKAAVRSTIEALKLNEDDDCVEERRGWADSYRNGEIAFSHLKRKAPFVAYEMKRQSMAQIVAPVAAARPGTSVAAQSS